MERLLLTIALGATVVACLVIAISIFVKTAHEKEGKKVLKQFLIIEGSLFIASCILFLAINGLEFGIFGMIFFSLLYTLFLNIPIAIIAKIASLFIKRK